MRQEKPYLSDKLPPAEPEVGKVRFETRGCSRGRMYFYNLY